MSTPSAAPDVRAYLEIRTSAPSGFSPDAGKLLISSNLPGTAQLYRLDLPAADGGGPLSPGELVQVTDFSEPVAGAYLPTREELLLAMDAGGNERHQLYLMADRPASEGGTGPRELVHDPEHIHRPGGVTRDGSRLAYATNRRNGTDFDVWVRELSGPHAGEERMVYGEGGWCGAAGFSPDGRWLAITRLTERPGDNQVHLLELATGTSFELLPHGEEGGEAAVAPPSWLPDSSACFFAHSVGTDFSVIARHDVAAGTTETVLDLGWDAGCAVDWTGRHLLVVANVDGRTAAWLHDPSTLRRRQELQLPGAGTAGSWAFSRDGRLLTYAFSSPLVPGDTWLHDLDSGRARRLTASPSGVDPATFVEPQLVRVASFDGEQIPVFVFRPRRDASSTGSGRVPVVVMIHGGPESQYRPAFAALTQYLVAAGFAVVAPNVRGSTGYGKRFEHLDDVDKRLDAVADLAAVHDWLATTDDLDPDRAALYGGSYGGYLTLCGLAFQPERWAAGVDIVGMSSLVTFLERTAPWRRRFREREYGSLERDRALLEAASPLGRVDAIRAPLFLLHGANDPRVPRGEAEQIAAVLAGKGVRCDLRVYEDEGHGLAKLANRIDAYPRVVDFLTEVLAP